VHHARSSAAAMTEKAAANIVLLQWNTNGIRPRLAELKNYISENNQPDIICIQETFLKPNIPFLLHPYNIERRDRTDGEKGGLATLIKQGIQYTVVPHIPDIEELTIAIKLQQQKIYISNIYNPPDHKLDSNIYNQLCTLPNIILLGDLNAHSALLGGKTSSVTGKELEEIIDSNNLVALNDGSGTHLKQNGELSAIDVTLASSNLAAKCDWKVHENTMGSDHFPIITSINEQIEENRNYYQERYNFNKADWAAFKRNSKAEFDKNLYDPEPSTYCNNINNAIHSAARSTIPIIRPSNRTKTVPYWNTRCRDAVQNRNKAERKMKKSRLLEDCIKYRQEKALAQHTLREEQQHYWEDYCSNLNSDTKLTSVWKMSKRMSGNSNNSNIPTLIHNNNKFESDAEKVDIIAETIANTSSNTNYSPAFQQHRQDMEQKWKAAGPTAPTEHQDMTAINGDFELNELIAAIKSTKAHSAPGEDNMTYELLKHLPKSALKKLLLFFNDLWKNEKIIPAWKTAIVLPFYKPGKDKHSPESYRPISLTSALCKINEKLITTRLIWFLETNNIINPAQSAYRKNRSTLDHLIRLTDSINKTINNKRHTVGIFFDFSHAFDMIWKEGLLHKLDRIGISGRIKSWITDFLDKRKIKVKINNTISQEYTLDNGTPQGSVISPILFLIMINDFPTSADTDIHTSLFADDSAIWKSGANLERIINSLKPQVKEIAEWCDTWGFTLNEKKTTAVIFSKNSQIRNSNVPILINGKTIATAKSIKFLGLTFDQQLTWNEHINNVIIKSKSKINLLRSISGSRWGANKKTLIKIYRTIIRPKLEYGLEVMTSITKSARRNLEKIQNTCLRICTGAMKSTSIDVLQQECGELPIRLRQQENLLKYSNRIQGSLSNPAISIHEDSWENHYGNYRQGNEPIFKIIDNYRKTLDDRLELTEFRRSAPWRNLPIICDTEILTLIGQLDNIEIRKSVALEHIEKYKNHIQLYTDASKTNSRQTGCAFYNKTNQIEYQLKLPSSSSIETAEAIAIQQALQHITTSTHHDIKLAIFTDSLSTINSIELAATAIHTSIHTEIINQIQDLQLSNNISTTIIWIPSHVGIRGNENADRLAKMAATQQTPPTDRTSNKTDRKQQIIDYINSQWQDIYNTKITGKHYKSIVSTVSRQIKYSDNNRHKETIITRLRLGKCFLNAYLHEIKRHPTGLCDKCHVPETIQHFLIDCTTSPIFNNPNPTIPEVLTDDKNIEIIYRHIKMIGRRL